MEDIDNPKYDKRRKSGEDSFQTFKAGTRFLLYYHDEHSTMSGLPRELDLVELDLDGARITIKASMLVKLFYASSRVVEPASIADLVAVNGVRPEHALKELLDGGRVTIMDIDQAMVRVIERRKKEYEDKLAKRKTLPTTTDTSTNSTPPPEA